MWRIYHRITLFAVVLNGLVILGNCKQESQLPRTLFVSSNGTNTKDCGDIKTPCETIRYSISKSSNNDLILLTGSHKHEFAKECGRDLATAIAVTHNIAIEGLVTTGNYATLNCLYGYGFLISASARLDLKNFLITNAFAGIVMNDGFLTLENVTVKSCHYAITCPAALTSNYPPGNCSVSVQATRTNFVNNTKSIITFQCADYANIELNECVLRASPLSLFAREYLRLVSKATNYIGGAVVPPNNPSPVVLYTNGKKCILRFYGGTFDGFLPNNFYTASVLWISITVEGETLGQKNIAFTNVVFQNSQSSRAPIFVGGGCNRFSVNIAFLGCTFRNNTGQLTGAVNIASDMPCHTHFDNCTFENNFATHLAGAIKIGKNSDVIISNSQFTNQSAAYAGGTIYSEGKVTLINTTMVNADKHALQGDIFYATGEVRLLGGVHIVVKHEPSGSSVFWTDVAKIKIQNNYTVECPMGNILQQFKALPFDPVSGRLSSYNYSMLSYYCQECPTEKYTLDQGTAYAADLNNAGQCHPCPFGADCRNGRIFAVPGFWGQKGSTGLVELHSCPEGYCCSDRQECLGYSSCRPSRRGRLCGECLPGYSETLLTTQCKKNKECHDYWAWFIALVLALVFVLFLLYTEEVVNFLQRHVFWWRNNHQESDLSKDQPSIHSEMEDISQSYQSKLPAGSSSSNGYQTIVFYFYQASSFLRIQPIFRGYSVHGTPLKSLLALFNLQPFIGLFKHGVCPVVGLTARTKVFLLGFSTIVLPLTLLTLIYFIFFAVDRYRARRRAQSDLAADDVPTYDYKTKCLKTLLSLFLLSYASMASMTFSLLHCIQIGDSKVLLVAGYTTCYQPWQYFFVVYAALSIIPLWIVVSVAPYLVRTRIASANEVVYACAIPLPVLVWWVIKWVRIKYRGAEFKPLGAQQQEIHFRLISILDGPFLNESSDNNLGPIYWQGVFTARRLILALISVFVYDPATRLLCLTIVCLLVLCHHFWAKPFNSKSANNLELASLISLTILALLNLVKAVPYSGGYEVERRSRLGNLIVTTEWLQNVILWLPLVLMFLFVLLTQVGRLVLICVRKIKHCD